MLQAPAPLTARGVFKALHAVAAEKGAGAANRRKQIILRLLRSCRRGPGPRAPPGPPCEREASSQLIIPARARVMAQHGARARAHGCSSIRVPH